MPECPHCKKVIAGKDIRERITFKAYRTCPHCRRPFTVDISTKYRQTLGIAIALISLALTFNVIGVKS